VGHKAERHRRPPEPHHHVGARIARGIEKVVAPVARVQREQRQYRQSQKRYGDRQPDLARAAHQRLLFGSESAGVAANLAHLPDRQKTVRLDLLAHEQPRPHAARPRLAGVGPRQRPRPLARHGPTGAIDRAHQVLGAQIVRQTLGLRLGDVGRARDLIERRRPALGVRRDLGQRARRRPPARRLARLLEKAPGQHLGPARAPPRAGGVDAQVDRGAAHDL
jgi:hypothetical protein